MNKKKTKQNKTQEQGFAKTYKQHYKKLLIIPILCLFFSIITIVNTTQEEGTPIYRDVSLKGGLSSIIEIQTQITTEELETQLLTTFPQNSFSISELIDDSKLSGFIIDTDLEETNLITKLNEIFNNEIIQGENYNSNFISPTLSNAFFKQAIIILIISFVLMSGVVFIYFRELVPSGAVVLSAIFDIIVTIGILNILNFKISVAGIGAIIMLIGYSIDTDVLLTNRLIKERGSNYFEKTYEAFKTGSLMSITTLIAGIGAIILTNSNVISEIATILVIGLIVDYISTWIQNTTILLWWLESK